MTTGERIKQARILRGMSLKELGLSIGLKESSADVRIAQYESGTRIPKEKLLRSIAKTLNVSFAALNTSREINLETAMYMLLALDDQCGVSISDTEQKRICFASKQINNFLTEWQLRKQQLSSGIITEEEYRLWTLTVVE
ncbi:MAG: helix-turn-helix transcriptional regulator [Clostridiaceae bacterium]|nr:helix-turn-helix transcriptional regulator [Clostridiaceae bacterium]